MILPLLVTMLTLLLSIPASHASDTALRFDAAFVGFPAYFDSNLLKDARGWKRPALGPGVERRVSFSYQGPERLRPNAFGNAALFARVTHGLVNVETGGDLFIAVLTDEEIEGEEFSRIKSAYSRHQDDEIAEFIPRRTWRPCILLTITSEGYTERAAAVIRSRYTRFNDNQVLECMYQLVRSSFGFEPFGRLPDRNQQILFDLVAVRLIAHR